MKFMQRAAAAASPSSPVVSQSEDERPSKRAKTESRSSPGTPQTQSPLFDKRAAQAALDAEEKKREILVERQAEKLGDAHWKLDPQKLPGSGQRKGVPLNIVRVGFSQIDRADAAEMIQLETDGPSFRSYQPKSSKQIKAKDENVDVAPPPPSPKYHFANSLLQSDGSSISDSDTDSDADSDSSDSSSEGANDESARNTPGRASYGTQKRKELDTRKSAEREKSKKLAEKRRERDVNLNKLTSISGAGSGDPNSKGSNAARRR